MDDYEDDEMQRVLHMIEESPQQAERSGSRSNMPLVEEPRGALSSLFDVSGLDPSLFPATEQIDTPTVSVDPRRKWRAFSAGMLKGNTFAGGLSSGLEALSAQEQKDQELYAQYLPKMAQAKRQQAEARLRAQQQQQQMMNAWNQQLLATAAQSLNQPGPVDPKQLLGSISGAVQTGRVPQQVAQRFLQSLPQDPVMLRSYLERTVMSQLDPFRAFKPPALKTVAPETDLVEVKPDGTARVVKAGSPRRSTFEKTMIAAGIEPGSPEWIARTRAYLQKLQTHQPPNQQTVIMKEEAEESKAVGKFHGEQYADIQKSAMSSQGKLANLSRLEQLLRGVATHKLQPLLTDIQGYAAAFGIKLSDKLGEKEAIEALTNELALQARNPSGGAGMPGALSDSDREYLKRMAPGLAKSPAGNRLIIETLRLLARRDIEVARLAAEYRRKTGHIDVEFQEVLRAYSEANPLFAGMIKPSSVVPPADRAKRADALVKEAQGGK